MKTTYEIADKGLHLNSLSPVVAFSKPVPQGCYRVLTILNTK